MLAELTIKDKDSGEKIWETSEAIATSHLPGR
jgi:hypothetical protein